MKVRKVSIVILASGYSKRYGRNKLLEKLGERTVLEHTIQNAMAAGSPEIIAVVEPGNQDVRSMIPRPVLVVENDERHEGIGSSVRYGLARVSASSQGVIFLVGDQPLLDSWTMKRMIEVFSQKKCGIVSCSLDNELRNPILFGRKYFDELMRIKGDQGAKKVAARHLEDVCRIEVEPESLLDIDTRGDMEKAREILKRRGTP